jgi:uncharacterized membrane protein YfcA
MGEPTRTTGILDHRATDTRQETFMNYRNKSLLWCVLLLAAFAAALLMDGELRQERTFLLVGLCFACELIDSGLGMGYGTLLTPTLLLLGYAPPDIVPTILVSELLSGFAAAFFHNEIRNVDLRVGGEHFKPALLLAGGSVAGVSAGVFLAVSLPAGPLRMLIGCIILLSGLFVVLLSRRAIEYRHWKMFALATVASFNKAVSGGGYGPLVTSGQILSGVRGKSAVGITSFAEAFTCLMGVTLFLLKGGYLHLTLLIPMCAGALLSVPFSVFAVNKANEDHLKVLIGVLTLVMGALTIYKTLD